MNTPIADFCRSYAESDTVRLHMPGHKGRGPTGCEAADLTEITGADSLYEAHGIIAESEDNASSLFGTRHTYYSAGGSSQTVKALCLLACRDAVRRGRDPASGRPVVLAGRNAHRSFVQAAQLIGFDIVWLPSEADDFSLCRCSVTADGLERALQGAQQSGQPMAAVYLTTPDYLGSMLDVGSLARTAHNYGVPLVVDNAHGAYLRFLTEDCHPITLGADACADSAHKTLPVLTGGSYLHISKTAPAGFDDTARDALCHFGSTSPSYLVLASLDECNPYLEQHASSDFPACAEQVGRLKSILTRDGLIFAGSEPIKLTLDCAASRVGSGPSAAAFLRKRGIECEYADPDYLVMMWSPSNRPADYRRAEAALRALAAGAAARSAPSGASSGSRRTSAACARSAPSGSPPAAWPPAAPYALPEQVFQPYDVLLAPSEELPVGRALGRVCAGVAVGCPPAVLPVVAGERVTAQCIAILQHYGIQTILVLCNTEL